MDKLNALSYAYHYRNIDSTEVYAQKAYDLSQNYDAGKAEAINNLAFVRIVQMRYDEAKQLLDQLPATTDNQLELLVGYVQQMRLCQRRSENRAFYDYREQARRTLKRLEEERDVLTDRDRQRLIYAKSELAIINSTYYYYIGLVRESIDALNEVGDEIERDTAQYLNYLYNVGAGGMITAGTQEDINQTEFDYLMRCFIMADRGNYPYFAANSLEALAEHLIDSVAAQRLIADNLPAIKFLSTDSTPYEMMPILLAELSLEVFMKYGDVYQIAGAYRTLASCCLAQQRYDDALYCLHQALADSTINQAPDLVASIREQMSVAYSAINDKPSSDYNRNIYLDLQEKTRQDRSLEARAGQLEQSVSQLNNLLWALGGTIVLLALVIVFFGYRHRKRASKIADKEWTEREDELKEQMALTRLHVQNNERLYLEQRAKISMVNTITPFIDRILYTIKHLPAEKDGDAATEKTAEQLEYIRELTDKINEQNDVLTHWIQLRQGELNLHVESFGLQELFDLVGKSKMGFKMRNINLEVVPTTIQVKADKVLTLFMLNTLADNARKFTPDGGQVTISAEETDDYVELSVKDNGVGIDEAQQAHLFEHHAIKDDARQASHGFGLLNCKGIIEKYRKMSAIFNVCLLGVESRKGEGSRFYFRLPKGRKQQTATKGPTSKVMLSLLLAIGWTATQAAIQPQTDVVYSDNLGKASVYADSAYFSNINGTYQRTLLFADSCRYCLNQHAMELGVHPQDTLLGIGDQSVVAPDIDWFHHDLKTNYNIILDIRNESAVAALALHEWALYNYNNRIYTQLFKELSADKTIDDYCRKMQQAETNKTIAIVLLVLFLVGIIIAVMWQVMIVLRKSVKRQQEQQAQLELMEDELQRARLEEGKLHVANAVLDNCLSTLKHETMYYPSRIRQLVDTGNTDSLQEVVDYYRELYGILSMQAMRQVEHLQLHVKQLDHEILGDPDQIHYLFEILRKQAGEKTLSISYAPQDDKYVVCRVEMSRLHLSEEQAAVLFTAAGTENIPYLICRQIVRDHGEATNRRGCAVRAEVKDGLTTIIIILPRIWKTSK